MVLFGAAQGSAAEVVETGACGGRAAYTLYDDGLLVIEGEGTIEDSLFGGRDDIISVGIPKRM